MTHRIPQMYVFDQQYYLQDFLHDQNNINRTGDFSLIFQAFSHGSLHKKNDKHLEMIMH